MSEYVTHTFVQSDDTDFATEFADCITKRDAWLSALQDQINQTPNENGLNIPGLNGRSLAYRTGTDLAKVAKYEARMVSLAASAEADLIAGRDAAFVYKMQQVNKMIAAAEDVSATEAEQMIWQASLAKNPASNLYSLGIFSTPNANKTQSQKDFSSAYLDYLKAKKVLITAIENDIGKDYQLTKWISESLTTWKDDDANDLILKLLKPTYRTSDAIFNEDNDPVLQSTINPRHINAKVDFQWGTTNTYGQFQPATQSDQGKGEDDIIFASTLTGLNPNTLYHFAVRLLNKYMGYFYGDDKTLTTGDGPPDPEMWNVFTLCNGVTSLILYSAAGSVLAIGVSVFTDSDLTTPYNGSFSNLTDYFTTISSGEITEAVTCISIAPRLDWDLHDSDHGIWEEGSIANDGDFSIPTTYSPTPIGKTVGIYPKNILEEISTATVTINGLEINRAMYNDNINWDIGNWTFGMQTGLDPNPPIYPFMEGENTIIVQSDSLTATLRLTLTATP